MARFQFNSSIGCKLLMAVSGLLLFGFVVGHLGGNLTIFAGQDALNSYAEHVKGLGPLLWVARGGLLLVLALHLRTAVLLVVRNRAARRVGYQVQATQRATLMSLTMLVSGAAILLFVGFHLLHFTAGKIGAEHAALYEQLPNGATRHHVYAMVYNSFRDPRLGIGYCAIYIAAMIGLGFHLAHGLSSLLNTFGCYHRRLESLAIVLAAVLALGYIAIPVAARSGLLKEPQRVVAQPAEVPHR
jgi:succinate dehydrogenase / fumarate reductase cytochrome b subunit